MLLAATFFWMLQQKPVIANPSSISPSIASQSATSDTDDLTITPAHEKEIEHDIKEGQDYEKEVLKEDKVDSDPARNQRVQRLANPLVEIVNTHHLVALWGDHRFSRFPYKFTVLKGKDVNAFSLPGGFIFVYDGLLDYVQSDAELSGVLAHEISHCAFRHVATLEKQQSKLSLFTIPLLVAGLLTGNVGLITGGQLVNQAEGSGWSQQAEDAADYGGFQILTFSKQNPTGMLTMMEHLARDEKAGPNIDFGIYRTHPPSPERANNLEKYMREDKIPIQRSLVSTTFRATMKPESNGIVGVWFHTVYIHGFAGDNAVNRATDALTAINTYLDTVPQAFTVNSDDSGNIIGTGQTIFTVTNDDAVAEKVSLSDCEANAVKGLKSAIFSYRTRIWLGSSLGP